MPSTVIATHGCPPPRDGYCSRNSSASTLPWVLRRHTSAPSSRCVSNPVPPLTDPVHCGVIFTRASLSTALISANSNPTSAPTPSLPRKESGVPLKSSLKVKGTPSHGSLTVITNFGSSKSAPGTLVHKGVRFHSQLEHVKLFFAKQKPLAVSRDGNPTDTSGTDSEFPLYIGARSDDLKDRPLVMHRIDVPPLLPLAGDTRDVAVESIDWVGTTVEGVVRVRNLAFEKWIAVRFTLDNWQTTSEVTARYKDSLPNGTFDRFAFEIKLADVFSRAEEKTIYLAVRYSVAGREIWDNNNGRNYQVRVVREKAQKVIEAAAESHEESSRAEDIADLQRKLEQVVKLGGPSKIVSGILAQETRRRWESPSPTPSPPTRDGTPGFKSKEFLAARYDFAASSRASRRPPATPRPSSELRINTYRRARLNLVQCPHFPRAAPCGSPRGASCFSNLDLDCDRDPDDAITPVPRLCRHSGSRNHTRGGCIDLSDAPCVKCTSPTSPIA